MKTEGRLGIKEEWRPPVAIKRDADFFLWNSSEQTSCPSSVPLFPIRDLCWKASAIISGSSPGRASPPPRHVAQLSSGKVKPLGLVGRRSGEGKSDSLLLAPFLSDVLGSEPESEESLTSLLSRTSPEVEKGRAPWCCFSYSDLSELLF